MAALDELDGHGHERRVVEHSFVEHPSRPDGPAVVDLADAILVRYADVRQELLTELLRSVEHLDLLDLDAVLVQRAA